MDQILLKGGRVIDPAHQIGRPLDVLIKDGRIAEIGTIDATTAARDAVAAGDAWNEIDCAGKLVVPGLIDTHGHIYEGFTGRFGLNADNCSGVRAGVTTVIDQGGPSCMTLPGFRKFIVEPAHTRVLAFLSAYLVGGLEGHYYPSLYRPDCLDVEATVRACRANPDLVRGIKAHAEIGGFSRWGVEVMRLASQIGREADLPVYIHFGQLWPQPEQDGLPVDPDSIFGQVLDMLKPGDVLAHPFSRHPGGFVVQGNKIHPMVTEAVARGVKIDVGHGAHFSLRTARTVLDAGIVPDTLGADLHGYVVDVPAPPGTPLSHPDEEEHLFAGQMRFSLVSAMSTMLALGLPIQHVVAMATINAARMAGLEDQLGTLAVGRVADVSVLDCESGRWRIRDNEGTEMDIHTRLSPAFCLRAGRRFDADSPLLPVLQPALGLEPA
ncbi:MAG: amidohydrolase/deacetylase family metallohydrolase [Burkholderiaceae bacterium]|nr:amidohydrolase/deacetylase family metallohydrolase [Burkholderiaceae bacterium]